MPQRIPFEREIPRVLAATEDQNSHRELDPDTFHASQLGYCERQILMRKLGLADMNRIRGLLRIGTLIHETIRRWFEPRHPRLEFETPVEFETEDGLTIIGHADIYDPQEEVVYDIKSQAAWYYLSRPKDRHRQQVEAYMRALGAVGGQIVYVNKKNLEVRFDPQLFPEETTVAVVNEDPLKTAVVDNDDYDLWGEKVEPEAPSFFAPDDARFEEMKAKANTVRDALLANGIPTDRDSIPIDKCGCYFCENERLDFSGVSEMQAEFQAASSRSPSQA